MGRGTRHRGQVAGPTRHRRPVQREPELDEEADEAYDAQLETALLLMRIKLASDTDWTFPDEAVAAADEPRSPTKN